MSYRNTLKIDRRKDWLPKSKCCICKEEFIGFGNNAEPLLHGKCCDECNKTKVLPLRMKQKYYNHQFGDLQGDMIEFPEREIIQMKDIDKYFKGKEELIDNDKLDLFKVILNRDNDLRNIYNSSLDTYDRMKCFIDTMFKLMFQSNQGILHLDLNNQMEWAKKNLDVKKDELDFMSEVIATKNCIAYKYLEFLKTGKLIKIDEDLKYLIENTDNKIFYRKSPFPIYYLDVSIKYKELVEILGIHLIEEKNKDNKNSLEFVVVGIDKRDKSEFYIRNRIIEGEKFETSNNKTGTDWFNEEETIEITNLIMKFICNFLDFLNHPHIYKTIISNSYNNENRIKKGKSPLNDKVIIHISEELKKYLPTNQSTREFTHKFFVRAHYIHFRNKIRYKRLYKFTDDELDKKKYQLHEGLLSKWVPMCIKGHGELRKKDYIVKE